MTRAFPRYGGGIGTLSQITTTLPNNSPPVIWAFSTGGSKGVGFYPNLWTFAGNNLTPATALVFWLGGMQDLNGNFIGFSADPTDPFDVKYAAIHGVGTYQKTRIGPFFDFQKSRVSGYFYFPDNGLGTDLSANSPYLYFVSPYINNAPDNISLAQYGAIEFGPGTCT